MATELATEGEASFIAECAICKEEVRKVYAIYNFHSKRVQGDIWACEPCWTRFENQERRQEVRKGEMSQNRKRRLERDLV